MDLYEFDQGLRAVAALEDSRPFLCEGSPLDCKVFLVGLNPRTQTPFEPYWDVSYGCHKTLWLEEYMRREGRPGPTRRRINILVDALAPVRCLETNLHAAWSARLADLPRERRSTAVFDFLLEAIKPRLLFVHGGEAVSYVERRAGCSVPLNQFQRIRLAGRETYVYGRHHLSYQLSNAECRNIGDRLRDHLLAIGSEGGPAQKPEFELNVASTVPQPEASRRGSHASREGAKDNEGRGASRLTGNEIKVLTALRDGIGLTRLQLRERTGMGEKGWSKLLGAATREAGGVQG